MDAMQTLKQQLPFPYNQDLSRVLRHLDRRTPFSRDRLANDPVTAAYIAAAERLLKRQLGPEAERTSLDPEDNNGVERPVLSFLSQRAVAAEVANNPDPLPRRGNVSTMRSTWSLILDFLADLLRFGLWYQHYLADQNDEMTSGIERLIAGEDSIQAIRDIAYIYLTAFIDLPMFRLKLIAAAAAEGDDTIHEAMFESYEGGVGPWKEVYAEFLRARGLRLRSGISIDDFVDLLASVLEGATLRALADPGAQVVDHSSRRSLLGTATLALMLGCLERTEQAHDLTLEQAVHALIYDTAN